MFAAHGEPRRGEAEMSATAQEGGVATVRRFYDLIGEGRLEDALGLLHEDLIIHEPADLPYGGEYHGPQAFTDIMGKIMATVTPSVAGENQYFETSAGGPVVVTLRGRFTHNTTGAVAETDVVELFTVRDGKILDLDVYYKTPGAIAALWT
jgi:uncharacterized protein